MLGISLQIDNARSILDGISHPRTPHVIVRGHLSPWAWVRRHVWIMWCKLLFFFLFFFPSPTLSCSLSVSHSLSRSLFPSLTNIVGHPSSDSPTRTPPSRRARHFYLPRSPVSAPCRGFQAWPLSMPSRSAVRQGYPRRGAPRLGRRTLWRRRSCRRGRYSRSRCLSRRGVGGHVFSTLSTRRWFLLHSTFFFSNLLDHLEHWIISYLQVHFVTDKGLFCFL